SLADLEQAPRSADRTLPSCGFSLAVSGRTMPLRVMGFGFTMTRSPSGLTLLAMGVVVLQLAYCYATQRFSRGLPQTWAHVNTRLREPRISPVVARVQQCARSRTASFGDCWLSGEGLVSSFTQP